MPKVPLNTPDKQVGEKRLREMVKELEHERAGLIAPKRQRVAAEQPLRQHLADFVADLQVKRALSQVNTRVNILIEACGWAFARNVSSDAFICWRAAQKKKQVHKNQTLTVKTCLRLSQTNRPRKFRNPLRMTRFILARHALPQDIELVRAEGIEPSFQAWEAHVLAFIRRPQDLAVKGEVGGTGLSWQAGT